MMPDQDSLVAETRALLESDRVTAPTRRVLLARMEASSGSPRFLNETQLTTLEAVAARLIPLGKLGAGLALASRYDADLAQGPGDGWRYADLPGDRETSARALDALEAMALAACEQSFHALPTQQQDELLGEVQAGRPRGAPWPFASERWFEEVLAALARLAYAHPLIQVAIGYDGFADAHGVEIRS